ncbi:MAG: disulfide bond formation protein B [Alphaproteobacteria bacterium]|nr:disulfide bond formation protein B [Alphaproteobacteria bacterium]
MNLVSRLIAWAKPLVDKALTMPLAAGLVCLSGIASLAFALMMQHVFGILPCDLCVWQRYPYGTVVLLALLCFLWKPYGRQTVILLGLCSLIYFGGSALAVVHSGVERHWWKSPTECVGESLNKGSSIEELRQMLLQTENPPCDEIPWQLFGLSLANMNVAWFFVLAVFAALATQKARARIGKS